VETLILKIQDLARGGAGVSRDDSGRVIFVPYTAPGDEVRVRIVDAKKNYAQAELLEVIHPSPQRQQPPCPAFGKCGGCQWQHLPYELQWRTKVGGVAHALKRVGLELSSGTSAAGQLAELPAERIWEYRNRVQLRGHRDELGFYAAGSNQRVPVDRCAIARPELNAAWEATRDEGRRFDLPYKVELEVLPDGQLRRTWNAGHAAAGFRQVHDDQNEKLKAWVAGAIAPGSSVLDLFGGAGNLSLGLGASGIASSVDCVDIGAPAGPRAGELARAWAGREGAYRFHRAPTARWIVKQASLEEGPGCQAAILDPPREGLGQDFAPIAESLEKLGARQIVAVGCDVDAWARDVSRFVKRGWRLERAAVLDLFPQTPHVESLARLVRDC
jgi:23S rRNA (uracil1939-C5)-methyltransferase